MSTQKPDSDKKPTQTTAPTSLDAGAQTPDSTVKPPEYVWISKGYYPSKPNPVRRVKETKAAPKND